MNMADRTVSVRSAFLKVPASIFVTFLAYPAEIQEHSLLKFSDAQQGIALCEESSDAGLVPGVGSLADLALSAFNSPSQYLVGWACKQ